MPVVLVPGRLALGALNHLGHWHGTCTRPLIHTSWRLLPLEEAKTQKPASQDGVSAPTHLRRDFSELSSIKTGTKIWPCTFLTESLKPLHLYHFIYILTPVKLCLVSDRRFNLFLNTLTFSFIAYSSE